MALAVLADDVAVVTLEDPAGRRHHLVTDRALEILLEDVVVREGGRAATPHPVLPVEALQPTPVRCNL